MRAALSASLVIPWRPGYSCIDEGLCMYPTYHLKADELDADIVQTLKNIFHQREIVILPKDEYDAWEKVRHNAVFTEELQNRIKELDEGKGIVKTMEELEALANG